MLRVNDEISLSTSVVRRVIRNGSARWVLGYKTHQRPDILIVARLTGNPEAVRDYFCFPYLLFGRNWLTFADGAERRIGAFRVPSVSSILDAFARVPIQLRAEAYFQSDYGKTWYESGTKWPTAGVEKSISAIVNFMRRMIGERGLIELIYAHGLRSMPRVLAPQQPTYSAANYGSSLVDFAVVWSFVARLMARVEIAAFVKACWPSFTDELKMTYFSVLTQGPLARVPPGLALIEGALSP